jgi:hypothetical protein
MTRVSFSFTHFIYEVVVDFFVDLYHGKNAWFEKHSDVVGDSIL